MSAEFKLPKLKEAIERIDNLMASAFASDNPAMRDWVAVRFALQAKHPDTERLEKLTSLGNVAIWYGTWAQHVPDESLRGRPFVDIYAMDKDCQETIEDLGRGDTLESAIDAARKQGGAA